MNKAQRIALLVGMLVAMCMLAYPPWYDQLALGGGAVGEVQDRGYAPLFAPPRPLHSVHIAWERLLLQIGIVATVTGVAFVLLGGDKKDPPAPTTPYRCT